MVTGSTHDILISDFFFIILEFNYKSTIMSHYINQCYLYLSLFYPQYLTERTEIKEYLILSKLQHWQFKERDEISKGSRGI